MEFDFTERVYLTLLGELTEEYRVPGVEDLFEDGKTCERLYSEMLEAYGRLRQRLGGCEEDPDIEIVINHLLAIGKQVGYAMYRYGTLFGKQNGDK